jgi:membrane-associated HD superfamily phosphohydrolase
MNTSVPTARRVSPFLLAILLVMLLLSLVSIGIGASRLVLIYPKILKKSSVEIQIDILLMILGFPTLAFATYMLFQTRKRVYKLGLEMQPLITTLLCQKCGFRNVRDFQRGDYVFKQTENPCPKCSEKAVVIGSIYREVKEKEKTRE